ncbi:hypothetical protein D3C72_1675280 [compost metagenome]
MQFVQILRGGTLVVLTQRNEKMALAVEHQARTEMQSGRQLRHLPEKHLEILQAAAIVGQPAPTDRGAALVAIGFGVRQVHVPVLRKVRRQRHIQQATLPARGNLRHP